MLIRTGSGSDRVFLSRAESFTENEFLRRSRPQSLPLPVLICTWPPANAGGSDSEVQTNAKTNLSRTKRARGNQKRIEECLTLFRCSSKREGAEVYEFTTEAEDGLVEHIVKLERRAKPPAFTQTKFASDI